MSNVEGRTDHHPFYTCFMVGLFLLSFTMVLVGVPVSAIQAFRISPLEQFCLSSVLFIGATFCVVGMSLGTSRFRPNADVRRSYRLGATGNTVLAFGIWAYTVVIIRAAVRHPALVQDWIYAAGQGVYPALIGLGFGLTGRHLLRDKEKTERNMPIIIRERGIG